jgi:CheY-like chemotaxis protein
MKHTILVVEDDLRNRKLLVDLLTVKGYRVLSANNGIEGVKRAREHLPDLILMDIQMPLMDGYEATRTLKGDALTRDIPTWALTSYAMAGDAARILAAGCDICITKPFDVPGLLRRIEACLGGTTPAGAP